MSEAHLHQCEAHQFITGEFCAGPFLWPLFIIQPFHRSKIITIYTFDSHKSKSIFVSPYFLSYNYWPYYDEPFSKNMVSSWQPINPNPHHIDMPSKSIFILFYLLLHNQKANFNLTFSKHMAPGLPIYMNILKSATLFSHVDRI